MEWINEHPGWLIVILTIGGIVFAIGKWVGGMNDFRTTAEGNIKTIQTDIKRILGLLTNTPYSAESPIKLTDLGRTISQELGAADWAQEQVDDLIDQVQGKQPYEIQVFCFEYVTTGKGFMDSRDRSQQVNNSAYSHGLDAGQVLRVVGIELRDALLKRLGIDVP